MDETWIHHFEPTTQQQGSEWKRANEPTFIKFRTQPSAGKILASVFWDAEGVILLDFLPKGQTITGVYYTDLVRRLRNILPETRRGLIARQPLFLQDNAPPHKSDIAMAALQNPHFNLLPHPPYSPGACSMIF